MSVQSRGQKKLLLKTAARRSNKRLVWSILMPCCCWGFFVFVVCFLDLWGSFCLSMSSEVSRPTGIDSRLYSKDIFVFFVSLCISLHHLVLWWTVDLVRDILCKVLKNRLVMKAYINKPDSIWQTKIFHTYWAQFSLGLLYSVKMYFKNRRVSTVIMCTPMSWRQI